MTKRYAHLFCERLHGVLAAQSASGSERALDRLHACAWFPAKDAYPCLLHVVCCVEGVARLCNEGRSPEANGHTGVIRAALLDDPGVLHAIDLPPKPCAPEESREGAPNVHAERRGAATVVPPRDARPAIAWDLVERVVRGALGRARHHAWNTCAATTTLPMFPLNDPRRLRACSANSHARHDLVHLARGDMDSVPAIARNGPVHAQSVPVQSMLSAEA